MRLYVTGGTGLVGSNIIRLARARSIEVIASQYGPQPEWEVDYQLDPLDLADHESIRNSMRKYQPQAVIHSAAILDQIFMDTRRELSWSLMVDGTRVLAEACREVGARLVFISSDWVFDGRAELVDETSPPFPVNFYGVMKMASERELSAMAGLNYAVGRLAGVYGLNYAAPSLLRQENGLGFDFSVYVIHRLAAGLPAAVWTGPKVNDVAHPDAGFRLCRSAAATGTTRWHGHLPIVSAAKPSAGLSWRIKSLPSLKPTPALIAPVRTDQAVLDAHRHIGIPYRTIASTERTAQALGRRAFNVVEGLHAFRQEWDAFRN